MKFGVIYTVDILGYRFEPHYYHLSDFHPRHLKHKRGTWWQSEKSGKQHSVVGQDDGIHSKFCAVLTKEQIKEFFQYFGFEHDSCCETMGAMGMPGVEPWYGTAPAWSFDSDSYNRDNVLLNVYVTPWPEIRRKTGVADNDRNWNRIKRAMRCLF